MPQRGRQLGRLRRVSGGSSAQGTILYIGKTKCRVEILRYAVYFRRCRFIELCWVALLEAALEISRQFFRVSIYLAQRLLCRKFSPTNFLPISNTKTGGLSYK